MVVGGAGELLVCKPILVFSLSLSQAEQKNIVVVVVYLVKVKHKTHYHSWVGGC